MIQEKEQHTDIQEYITESEDEPLFILKYKWWRIAWRLFFPYSGALPIFYMGAFYWSNEFSGFKFWFAKIVSTIIFFGGVNALIEMLLTKDIILYRDRIVKRYRFNFKKEIILERAKYGSASTWLYSFKTISDEKARIWHLGLKGILIDNHLINPNRIRKFDEILSQISNRSIEELHNVWSWSPQKLIIKQEGKS